LSQAKYVNSPETLLFRKGKVLFGLDQAKRAILSSGQAIIVEGQIDVISLHEAGISNVVAPLGTAMTEDHARMARRLADDVVLVFDGDKAGDTAARKAFYLLSAAGANVKRLILPDGQDPDSFIRANGKEAMVEALAKAKPYIQMEIDRAPAASSEERVAGIKYVADLLSAIDERVTRDSLASLAAIRFQTTIEDITKRVRGKKHDKESEAQSTHIGREWVRQLFATIVQREDATKLWQATDWKRWESSIKGVGVLNELLACHFVPSDKTSLVAAIADKSQSLESCALESFGYALPSTPTDQLIAECYRELRRDHLAAKLSRLKAELKNQPANAKEIMPRIMATWNELLELEKSLNKQPNG
jgi:DNA primase